MTLSSFAAASPGAAHYAAGIAKLVITLWAVSAFLLLIPIADLIFWRWRWIVYVDLVVLLGAWGFGIFLVAQTGAFVVIHLPFMGLATMFFALARWRRWRRAKIAAAEGP